MADQYADAVVAFDAVYRATISEVASPGKRSREFRFVHQDEFRANYLANATCRLLDALTGSLFGWQVAEIERPDQAVVCGEIGEAKIFMQAARKLFNDGKESQS